MVQPEEAASVAGGAGGVHRALRMAGEGCVCVCVVHGMDKCFAFCVGPSGLWTLCGERKISCMLSVRLCTCVLHTIASSECWTRH